MSNVLPETARASGLLASTAKPTARSRPLHVLRQTFGIFLGLVALALCSCEKAAQDAVVVGKIYIPAHVEGTEYLGRQLDSEQWLVKIEMTSGLKSDVPVEPDFWKAIKPGDHVHATYSRGKYTGTVWSIEIQKK